ncbi:MAG: hypothetical protein EF812_07060 [Methanosarcinales archaeon]|nr:MAG: hypothetical protein EF812_07060 [Methanosarcinales archaeon]
MKSKKRYTILNPAQIDEIHQVDFVGIGFIKGYGATSVLNEAFKVGEEFICEYTWDLYEKQRMKL